MCEDEQIEQRARHFVQMGIRMRSTWPLLKPLEQITFALVTTVFCGEPRPCPLED